MEHSPIPDRYKFGHPRRITRPQQCNRVRPRRRFLPRPVLVPAHLVTQTAFACRQPGGRRGFRPLTRSLFHNHLTPRLVTMTRRAGSNLTNCEAGLAAENYRRAGSKTYGAGESSARCAAAMNAAAAPYSVLDPQRARRGSCAAGDGPDRIGRRRGSGMSFERGRVVIPKRSKPNTTYPDESVRQ